MADYLAQLAASRKDTGPPPRSVNFWLIIILLLLILAASVRFLNTDSAEPIATDPSITKTPSVRPSRTYTVTYRSGVFSPTNLRIHSGDTVIFRNDDVRGLWIVSQVDPLTQEPYFGSGSAVANGDTFAFTFAEAGIFTYHRGEDEQEAGVIIVRAP